MFSPFERKLAWRYLWPTSQSGKRERFVPLIGGLAFLGIMLGVATLIIVMSVMNGFRAELIGKIVGFNGELGVYGFGRPLVEYKPAQEKIEKIPGVRAVNPMIDGQAMLLKGKLATGVLVRGVDKADLQNRPLIADHMVAGGLNLYDEKDSILLGKTLARRWGLEVGDVVRLVAPELNTTAFGALPRYKDFKIAGVFESGNNQYDMGVVFIPLASARIFFKVTAEEEGTEPITGLEVFLNKGADLDKIIPQVINATDAKMRLLDWRQTNQAFFEAVVIERNVMFIILTLIIIIAAFNIISSMVILVKDKTKDVGILRTMGATQGAILRIFFLTGSSIGVLGTAAGFVIGLLFCLNIESIRKLMESLTGSHLFNPEIYFLSKLPAIVQPEEVIVTVCVALFITFIFTLIPAWKAARLDPIEALRYE